MSLPEAITARDSVLADNATYGVYGDYSPWFPNPVVCFMEILSSCFHVFLQNLVPWNGLGQWLKETWEWHYICFSFTLSDMVYVLLAALFFTVLRFIMYKCLLERIPVWFGLTRKDGDKFPEAAYRTITYGLLWAISLWLMAKTNFFFSPILVWKDWIPLLQVPSDIYICYILQMGFYIHMIYATTYIETVRKDYMVQMIHHFLTLALLSYSLSLRFHNIGLFVLFIHDLADISLELAKCIIYFKVRNGVTYKMPEILANVIFAVFVLQWILFRLYWYPVKLLYAAGHVAYIFYNTAPFYCPFNIMLWILYTLHVYWFYFIFMLVIKVVTGEEIADNRDIEEKKEN